MSGMRILFCLVLLVLAGCTNEGDGDSSGEPGGSVDTAAAEFGEDFGTTRTEFSSETASLTVAENVKVTFKNLDDALAFLEDSMILDQVAEVLPFGSEESEPVCTMMDQDGSMIPCDEGPGFGPGDFDHDHDHEGDWGEQGDEGDEEGDFEHPEFEDDQENESEENEDWEIEAMSEDVIEFLEENVFLDTQLESDAEGTVVYLLSPEVFCGDDEAETVVEAMPRAESFDSTPMPPRGGEPCEEECPEGEVCVDGECYPEGPWGEEDGEWGEDGDHDHEGPWGDEDHGFDGPGDVWEEGEEEDSDSCAELLEEIQVRLQFTSKVEGEVQVAVLFGEEKHNPIRFEMSETLVALEVDLGAMLATVEELIDVLEGDDESSSDEGMEQVEEDEGDDIELETLAGVFRLSVENTGEKKMRVDLGLVEKFVLALKSGDDLIDIGLGSVLVGAEADGAQETISAEFALNDLSLTVPYQMVADMMDGDEGCGSVRRPMDMREFDGPPGDDDEPWREPPGMMEDDCGDDEESEDLEGTIALSLSGISAAGTFSSADEGESVQITGIGLGNDTTWLKYNEETILSVDLNANDGRLFDLGFTVDEDENATLEFTPVLDLVIGMNMASVAEELEPADWMIEETLTLNFSGADTPSITALADSEGDAMRVDSGVLTLSAASMPDKTLVVEAGMCMVSLDDDIASSEEMSFDEEPEEEEPSHPLDELSAGQCSE